jgi:hypothetical protein
VVLDESLAGGQRIFDEVGETAGKPTRRVADAIPDAAFGGVGS